MDEKQGKTFMEVVREIAVALTFVAAGALIHHEIRIAAIEASRYTPADALDFERETTRRFHSIETSLNERLAELDTKIEVVIAILKEQKEDRDE